MLPLTPQAPTEALWLGLEDCNRLLPVLLLLRSSPALEIPAAVHWQWSRNLSAMPLLRDVVAEDGRPLEVIRKTIVSREKFFAMTPTAVEREKARGARKIPGSAVNIP